MVMFTVCSGTVILPPLMVPVAVPPTRLKKLSMFTAVEDPPAVMLGEEERGNWVPLQVVESAHVTPVQFSAPIITSTRRLAVVVQ